MADLSLPQAINDAIEEAIFEEICISRYARNHKMLNKVTRQVKEMNCKSWRCPKHRKSWLQKWKVVVSRELAVNPVTKLITLTCAAPATPAQLCRARQLFFRSWRVINGEIEYFSVLEFTSLTRLPHLHILARGRYLRQKVVSALWSEATRAAGFKSSPVVYIERPRSQEAAGVYALSYALSGHAKDQDIPEDWHGNKVTYSKKFFAYKSVAEHWADWILETFGDDVPADWMVIPKGGAYDNATYAEKLAQAGLIPAQGAPDEFKPMGADPWFKRRGALDLDQQVK